MDSVLKEIEELNLIEKEMRLMEKIHCIKKYSQYYKYNSVHNEATLLSDQLEMYFSDIKKIIIAIKKQEKMLYDINSLEVIK